MIAVVHDSPCSFSNIVRATLSHSRSFFCLYTETDSHPQPLDGSGPESEWLHQLNMTHRKKKKKNNDSGRPTLTL